MKNPLPRSCCPANGFFILILKGEGLMKYIPIGSKQIAYVSYDDKSSQMHIQFHTGHSHICNGIDQEQVQRLMQSDNSYDLVMQLTQPPKASTIPS
jgi:hypothetical protein